MLLLIARLSLAKTCIALQKVLSFHIPKFKNIDWFSATLAIYSPGSHLGHVTYIIYINIYINKKGQPLGAKLFSQT